MLTNLINMANFVHLWLGNEDGQGMAEYALILALVSIAALVALTSLGTDIATVFTSITSDL